MKLVKTPSEAPRTALTYITIGAILTIWAAVWMWQFPTSHSRFLSVLCNGILLTGLALLVIGFSVGLISRATRQAESPPDETQGTTAGGTAVASNANANASQQPVVKPVIGAVGAPPSGNNGGA